MNAARRARLAEVQAKLEELMCEIEAIADEENDAYDNLPDSIRDSERGEKMSENVDVLYNIYNDLESVTAGIEEILE